MQDKIKKDNFEVSSLIYRIRNKYVILKSDLIKHFGIEPFVIKEALRAHPKSFTESHLLKLTESDFKEIKQQSVQYSIKASDLTNDKIAFTRDGIIMLEIILNEEGLLNVNLSALVNIMGPNTISYEELLEKISALEIKQDENQKANNKKFSKIFKQLETDSRFV